ncbi:MAG: hypothetical protein LBT50_00085 [Prevotellaceae bacterium]|jgi:hypothetical protein|nr:hypothetical protein [Prevotellaceae bacterium]
MNDRQESKFRMFRTVSEICHNNEQTYAGMPAFVNAVILLDNGINAISLGAQQQSRTVSGGVSEEKSRAGETLALESLKTANALYVYAIDTNNKTLQTNVSLNKSMFYNGHDEASLVLAKNIAAEAHSHAAELLGYGVNAAAIATLDSAVAAFESLIVKPQTTIDERKVYTGNIKQLFAETDSVIYDRLDKLITLFKTSDPDFYALYKNARNIIDTARRHEKKE